jgi:hypothetical protein
MITVLSGAVAFGTAGENTESAAQAAAAQTDVPQVPEPVSLALFGTGLGMVARRVRRNRDV